jgi:phosphatidylinositol-3-phosphatase
MENQDYSNIYGPQPYETSIANQFGLAENYYGIGHFSADNYITGTSGADWNSCLGGDGSPSSCPQSQDNIFRQLGAGQAQDLIDPGSTDVNHDPVEYYTDLGCSGPGSCPYEGSLPSSFTSSTFNPKFTLISPNKTDDGHDSSASTADSWLSSEVPKIMATPQYHAGTMAIFVVYDESNVNDTEGATSPPNNHVYASVISPYTSGVKDTTTYTHCSMLRTAEQIFSLPLLGCAGSANSMVGKFVF